MSSPLSSQEPVRNITKNCSIRPQGSLFTRYGGWQERIFTSLASLAFRSSSPLLLRGTLLLGAGCLLSAVALASLPKSKPSRPFFNYLPSDIFDELSHYLSPQQLKVLRAATPRQQSRHHLKLVEKINRESLFLNQIGLTHQEQVALLKECGHKLSFLGLQKSYPSIVLEFIQYCPNLVTLSVPDCHIGDAGAQLLANCPNFAGLEHLDISANKLSAKGVFALICSPHHMKIIIHRNN